MAKVEQAWPHAIGTAGRAADLPPAAPTESGAPRPLAARAAAALRHYGGAWLPGAVAVVLLTLPAWAPILRPDVSLWQLFDGTNHLRKAFFLLELIKEGNWYPRWTPQEFEGFGYPTFNFYAPLTYYLVIGMAAALPRVGLYGALQLFGALEAVSILLGLYTLVWSAWRHTPAAFLAAAALAYGPYFFPNLLFMSGWFPQLLGMALIVWLMVECYWLWRRVTEHQPAGRWWWAIVATTSALLMGHNASAIVGFPAVAGWLVCLWLWRRTLRPLFYAASAAAVAALATAVLWVPALLETSLVQVERMERGNLNFRNHFLRWPGFHREDVWGLQERGAFTVGMPLDFHFIYPNSAYGPIKLSVWQGLLVLAGLLALAHYLWRMRHATHARGGAISQGAALQDARAGGLTHTPAARLTAISAGFGVLLFLLCYSQSFDWWLPAWEHIFILRAVQLPERFLAPALYGAALAGAAALALTVRPSRRAWVLAVTVAVVLGITGTTRRWMPIDPDASHTVGVTTAIQSQHSQPFFTDSTEEFTPRSAGFVEWHEGEARGFWLYERMFPEAAWVAGRVRSWEGSLGITGVRGRLLWTEADVDGGSDGGTLAFHQLLFSGWRAWIDGQPVTPRVTPFIPAQAIQPGFLLVDVPPGPHRVSIRFAPDAPRLAGIAVSLITLAAAAGWLVIHWRRRGGVRFAVTGAALLAAVVVAGCRTALPFRPPAAHAGDRILIDGIIDDVLAGRASVSSPSGAVLGADKFVDVRSLTVQAQDRPLKDAGPSTRRWLFTHPPTQISVDLTVPSEAYFQASLAMDPAMWNAPLGDGVRYQVTVTPQGGSGATVLDLSVNPRAKGEQRRWLDVVADLRPWAGQAVRLTLRTDPRQDPSNDWAGWSEPAVVRLDPLTAARMMDSTAQLTALAFRE